MAITLDGTTGITTPDVNSTADISVNDVTVGRGAGAVSTNTAVGLSALSAATGSSDANTAIGEYALSANTTGVVNTAVGQRAIAFSNTTGSYNTGIGGQALFSNTTASNNTAVGYQAGYANTTGAAVTYIGDKAGYSTTGGSNTFVGNAAGYSVTTGTKNTILGRYDGNQGGLNISTLSNYIVLSDGDGNPRGYYSGANNSWAFNNGGAANNVVAGFYNDNASTPYGIYVAFTAAAPNNTTNYVFGANDSSTSVYRIWSNGTTSGRSDERLKKNITPANSQLADVMAMEVVNYEWNESIDGTKEIGWIAQQVQQVKPGLVQENDDGFLHLKREPMVAILWKAVQELNAKVEAQAAEIAALKGN